MVIFFHSYLPSSIVLSVGPVHLYWYGMLYLVSILLGYWLVAEYLRRDHSEKSQHLKPLFIDFAFGFLVSGLVGARLYHVLNLWSYYWQNPLQIFAVWNGGLAIHGAIIGGALYLLWFARRLKLPFLWLTDLIAPALLLGQAIGRFGNYFNQELFGLPTNLPWGIPISPENRPAGFESFTYFHPTFLYESLWDLFSLAILFLLANKLRKRPSLTSSLYLFLAGFGRFAVEFLRIDDVPFIGPFRLPMLFAAAMAVAGMVGIILCLKKMRYTIHTASL